MQRLCLLFVLLAMTTMQPSAQTPRRPDPESVVPLPKQLELKSPETAVGSEIARYHGAWTGIWGDDLRHVLVVESIAQNGAAAVIYATGDSAAYSAWASWQRTDGMLGDKGLRISLGYAEVTYALDGSDRLVGTFAHKSGQVTLGLLTRFDAPRLGSPHILDTWELPGERVFFPHTKAKGPDGAAIKLEARLYRPLGQGPAPLAIFSHGSDIGRNLLNSYSHLGEARWLLDRGFAVLVPMRRGRGLSEGTYGEATYDTSHSGQIIDVSQGIEEAIEDLEAALLFGRSLSFVRQGPVLLAGQSRGGFLSVVFAGRRPQDVLGVVSFAGGWMGGGPALEHFNTTYFAEAGKGSGQSVPQLWLYAERDSFYGEAHIRANHAAFEAAGGAARFEFYRGLPGDGHRLRSFPNLWRPAADQFLDSLSR